MNRLILYSLLLVLSLAAGGLMIESLTGQPVIEGLSVTEAIDGLFRTFSDFLRYLGL